VRALVVTLAITTSACIPHSAKGRKIAKYSEGAAILTGIVMQFVANAGECMAPRPGTLGEECEDGKLDYIGLGLILAGLAGFAATTIVTPIDPPEPFVDPDGWVWAAPLSFCAAIWANNTHQAEAALQTYMRSLGATTTLNAEESLHAWLSRQPCVAIEESTDASRPLITFKVPQREQRWSVDVSTAPFVILLAN